MIKRFFYIAAGKPAQCSYFKIKVGITNNPKQRIASLRSENYMLELFAVLAFDDQFFPRQLEKACLERFKKSRWLDTWSDGRGHIVKRYRREYFEGFPIDFLRFAEDVAGLADKKFVRVKV